MKTITLEEAFELATPLPWKPGLREPSSEKRKGNEALFIHTVNRFAELVAALERCLSIIEDLPFPEDHVARELRPLLDAAKTVTCSTEP